MTDRFEFTLSAAQPGGPAPITVDEFGLETQGPGSTSGGRRFDTEYLDCFTGTLTPAPGTTFVFSASADGITITLLPPALDQKDEPDAGTREAGQQAAVIAYANPLPGAIRPTGLNFVNLFPNRGCAGENIRDAASLKPDLSAFFIDGPGRIGRELVDVGDDPENATVRAGRSDQLTGSVNILSRSIFCNLRIDCSLFPSFSDAIPIPAGSTVEAFNHDNLVRQAVRGPFWPDPPARRPSMRGHIQVENELLKVNLSVNAEELHLIAPVPGQKRNRADILKVRPFERVATEPFAQVLISFFAFFLATLIATNQSPDRPCSRFGYACAWCMRNSKGYLKKHGIKPDDVRRSAPSKNDSR